MNTISIIFGRTSCAVILAAVLCVCCYAQDNPSHSQPDQTPASATIPDWRQLSLREKIGQTMIMRPDRTLELKLGDGSLEKYFVRYPITGYFMGMKLFRDVKEEDKAAHVRKAVLEYQAASRLPLLFQQDYEAGVALPGLTALPEHIALGAANSEDLAYDYGKYTAKESWSIGVRWVLNPVVDLSMNHMDPLVTTRSFGDNPERAVPLLTRQIAGIQDNGVAACAKHFPGDGSDSRDQHICTTCNSLSMPDWHRTYGRVFQAAIDAGVMSIMAGHITLPAYQEPKSEYLNGVHPPATLSKALLTDLLKGEMHFKGVIISDALGMGGFRGNYPSDLEGQIHCFAAGVDVMLWPSYEFLDELETRIKRGEIPMSRLDDAVSRVWEMKRKLGLLNPKPVLVCDLSPAEKTEAQAYSHRIAEQALTLVRDRNHALPLDPAKDRKILLLAIIPASHQTGDKIFSGLEHMKRNLQSRGFAVDLQRDLPESDDGQTDLNDRYDRIIVIPIRKIHAPIGPLLFWDDQARSVLGVNCMPKGKIIVVNMGNPCLLNEYFERVNTCINAYSYDDSTQTAVVRALLGDIPLKGISPVSLERPKFVPAR